MGELNTELIVYNLYAYKPNIRTFEEWKNETIIIIKKKKWKYINCYMRCYRELCKFRKLLNDYDYVLCAHSTPIQLHGTKYGRSSISFRYMQQQCCCCFFSSFFFFHFFFSTNQFHSYRKKLKCLLNVNTLSARAGFTIWIATDLF